jgi:hypothetical protein
VWDASSLESPLMAVLRSDRRVAGACYTEVRTEWEMNRALLEAERAPRTGLNRRIGSDRRLAVMPGAGNGSGLAPVERARVREMEEEIGQLRSTVAAENRAHSHRPPVIGVSEAADPATERFRHVALESATRRHRRTRVSPRWAWLCRMERDSGRTFDKSHDCAAWAQLRGTLVPVREQPPSIPWGV